MGLWYIYIWITIKNWRIYFEYVWILNMGHWPTLPEGKQVQSKLGQLIFDPAFCSQCCTAKRTTTTCKLVEILVSVGIPWRQRNGDPVGQIDLMLINPILRFASWGPQSYYINQYTSAPFPQTVDLPLGKIIKAQLSTGIIAVRMQLRPTLAQKN